MTIRAVIVDDEPLARLRVRDLLADAMDIEVIAECANGEEAIQAIEESPPDMLFLDVQVKTVRLGNIQCFNTRNNMNIHVQWHRLRLG